ncbi:hypothetical protein OIU74_004891 [Salix koriyanagi]|uniref:Uncharacterized protein n=1 Tax=Salix koriyanagi TaxID=2511006 RepID=A0A9Q0UNH4_9ROSI|nr:hypothetical protein OIU74_004891 [Salix koriyanagi]
MMEKERTDCQLLWATESHSSELLHHIWSYLSMEAHQLSIVLLKATYDCAEETFRWLLCPRVPPPLERERGERDLHSNGHGPPSSTDTSGPLLTGVSVHG